MLPADLRHATAGLDTGCWTGNEAARLSARFAEAEALGHRRATAHAELGDLLCRAADAFEEADTTALQQLMGMPAGWMEPSPVVPGAGMPLNSTALSTQMPAPASLLTNNNGTAEERLVWEFTLSPNALRLYAVYLQAASRKYLDKWKDWLIWGGLVIAIVGIAVALFNPPAGALIALLGVGITAAGAYLDKQSQLVEEAAIYLTGLAEAADHLNEETVTIRVYEVGETHIVIFESPSDYAQRWDALPPIDWGVKEEWSPSVVTAFHHIPGAIWRYLLPLLLDSLQELLIRTAPPGLLEATQ